MKHYFQGSLHIIIRLAVRHNWEKKTAELQDTKLDSNSFEKH